MNNSEKIPNDMNANLQQQARGLFRNRVQGQNSSKQKEVKNGNNEQAVENNSFVASGLNEDEVLDSILDKTSYGNEEKINNPLPLDTIVTNKSIINGQEVSTSYKIVEELKSGGFGMTYKVVLANHRSEKFFVLKEFYPRGASRNSNDLHINLDLDDENTRDALVSFHKEPMRIRKLIEERYAPNSEEGWRNLNLVIPKTEAFVAFKNLYYVMDYVEGTSLHDYLTSLKDFSSLSLADRLWIVKQLCNAVRNLHSIGCIHQDISPMNVMVNSNDKRVVLIDYGLCTSLLMEDSKYSLVKDAGTLGFWDIYNWGTYKSNHDKLRLLDIYSVGCILAYTCLLQKPSETIVYDFQYGLCINDEFNETDTPIEKKNKTIFNEIRGLVSNSTVRDLDKRIKDIDSFEKNLDYIITLESEISSSIVKSNSDTETDGKQNLVDDIRVEQDSLLTYTGEILDFENKNKEIPKSNSDQVNEEESCKPNEKDSVESNWGKNNTQKEKKTPKVTIEFPKIIGWIVTCIMICLLSIWGFKQIGPFDFSFSKSGEEKEKLIPEDFEFTSQEQGMEDLMTHPLANLSKLNADQFTLVLEKAQYDKDFLNQLEHYFDKDLTILQLDENGVPFRITLLQLFNAQPALYKMGEEYKVSEFELVNNKILNIMLIKNK